MLADSTALLFDPEDGDRTFLRSVHKLLADYSASSQKMFHRCENLNSHILLHKFIKFDSFEVLFLCSVIT
jgi:hypothetical protein